MSKLSGTMQAAVDTAREHGGRLVRWPGGFWTYDGCPVKYVQHNPGGDCDVPEWHVAAGTIKSLLARELVRESDWRETRGFNGPSRYAVAVEITERQP